MGMNREGAVDVLFVAMPFCDEYMPCLTLALFKSVLARAGIKSRVQHEYLFYANRIGLEKYRSIMQVCTIGYGHDYFACETIFAEAAHGKTLASFDDYIRWMQGKHLPGKVFAGRQREETLRSLVLFQEAHAMADAYLEEACARIMAQRPKIVAFISMFQQHNAALALLRRLKERRPKIATAMGGPNCMGSAGGRTMRHFPFSTARLYGKRPLTSFMFDCWFSTITAPVSAMILMSSSVRCTQCAMTVFGPSRPRSFR